MSAPPCTILLGEPRIRAHPSVSGLQKERFPLLPDAIDLRHLPAVDAASGADDVEERLAVDAR